MSSGTSPARLLTTAAHVCLPPHAGSVSLFVLSHHECVTPRAASWDTSPRVPAAGTGAPEGGTRRHLSWGPRCHLQAGARGSQGPKGRGGTSPRTQGCRLPGQVAGFTGENRGALCAAVCTHPAPSRVAGQKHGAPVTAATERCTRSGSPGYRSPRPAGPGNGGLLGERHLPPGCPRCLGTPGELRVCRTLTVKSPDPCGRAEARPETPSSWPQAGAAPPECVPGHNCVRSLVGAAKPETPDGPTARGRSYNPLLPGGLNSLDFPCPHTDSAKSVLRALALPWHPNFEVRSRTGLPSAQASPQAAPGPGRSPRPAG